MGSPARPAVDGGLEFLRSMTSVMHLFGRSRNPGLSGLAILSANETLTSFTDIIHVMTPAYHYILVHPASPMMQNVGFLALDVHP